jgi:hypothetical protein
MRKLLGIALALLLAAATTAGAGEVEGTIKSVDPADRTVVLEDGTRLVLAEGIPIENLKEGAKVKASYEERDGKNVVVVIDVTD